MRLHADRRRRNAGYTLLEMVVVLAIMALVTGVAAVRVFSMISSWRERTQLESIEQQFAHLPVLARQRGQDILLPPPASSAGDAAAAATGTLAAGAAGGAGATPPALILPYGWLVRFDHRLRVRANGFCEGAHIQLEHGDRHYPRTVTPPFCQLVVTPPPVTP
ncbi:MAG: type II secretion system protein [Xanthomonadaceae bacterium]|nr:type II secretion system protein [Xanthomonadaceae bacterium]MDE3072548.1 type II secretion system protein [Pseudomonadota bacterium]